MNLFIAILTDFSHFIKIIMAMNLFGNFEERINKYKIILIATIIALASGIIYFDEKMKIGSIVYFITTYAVFRMWYAEKRKLLLLFSIWIPFMMSMIDTMFLILVKLFLGLLPFGIKSFEELMASVLSLMFIYTVGYIYRKHYQYGLKKIEYKNLVLLTVLIVVNSIVVMTVAKVATIELSEKHKLVFSGAFIAVIVGIFIQLGAVILLKVSKNVSQERELETKMYLKEQQNYYEYLEEREKNTKKFRHDVRNHLELLTKLINSKQYEEVNDYYYQAIDSGVKMKVSGVLPTECRIDAYDLCTIFSNVLSNAIEAASKSKKKQIYLDCRYNDENIIINIRNTYKDNGQFKNKNLVTTKSDREYHGFGLENVRECVERNNGLIYIEIGKEEFMETISIKR